MVDYAKLVGIFNAFDKMSERVIADCEQFMESATETGAAIGGVAGALLGGNDRKTTEDVATVGTLLGAGVGALVGLGNKAIKYSSTKNELIKKINKHKESWYSIVSEAISDYEVQLGQLEKEQIPILITLLKKNDIETNIFYYREVLHHYIRQAFQYSYIIEKGKKILSYFDDFEEELKEDLGSFSEWSQSTIELSKSSILDNAYLMVYDKVKEYEPSKRLFSQLVSECPSCLTDETRSDMFELVRVVAQAYEDSVCMRKNTKDTLSLSTEYYKGSGFKILFNIISEYMYNLRIEKREKWVSSLFLWGPLVLTIIGLFISGWSAIVIFPCGVLFASIIFALWHKSFNSNSAKIFMQQLQTEDGIECLQYAEECIAENEFEQKPNLELIKSMPQIIGNDTDDTMEIKNQIDSFNSSMTSEELAEVEKELNAMDYDF